MMNKNITNRRFLFGDFDRDRIKNVDDPRPFNPKVKKWSQVSGSRLKAPIQDDESTLSSALKGVEKHNNQFSSFLKQFLHENPKSYGRIKSVASTVNKLNKRFLQTGKLTDIVGITIPVKNKDAVFAMKQEIEKKYKTADEHDDYYANPTEWGYRAVHLGILTPHGQGELQIKSKGFRKMSEKMHKYYKHGTISKKPYYAKLGEKLIKEGN